MNGRVGEHAHRALWSLSRREACKRMSGFTLVELVVASALMATLMFGLWGMVHLYTSLRDRGIAKLEQIREATELFQTLESDLRSALDASLPSGLAAFRGDAESLTLAQIAPVALDWAGDAARMPAEYAPEIDASPPLPPVVRRVRYQWIEVDEAFFISPNAPAEALLGEASVASLDANRSEESQMDRIEEAGLWRYDEQGSEFGPVNRLGGLPEAWRFGNVEGVRFSYYNGRRWTTRWDSAVQGRLPAAIRIEAWFHGGTTLGPRRMASNIPDASNELQASNELEERDVVDELRSGGPSSSRAVRPGGELDDVEGAERRSLAGEGMGRATIGGDGPADEEDAEEAHSAVPDRPADLIRWIALR